MLQKKQLCKKVMCDRIDIGIRAIQMEGVGKRGNLPQALVESLSVAPEMPNSYEIPKCEWSRSTEEVAPTLTFALGLQISLKFL